MNTSDKEQYFIVEFVDGLQLIPKEWIIPGQNEAFWPNYTSIQKYERAVEKRETPSETWARCKILKVLGKSKTFQRGKEKLKEAEFYSDLSTDMEGNKKKRHFRAKKRNFSSSSSSENESEEFNQLPQFPQIPKILKLNKDTPQTPNSSMQISSGIIETPSSCKSSTTENGAEDNSKLILKTLSGIKFSLAAISSTQKYIIKRLDTLDCKLEHQWESVKMNSSSVQEEGSHHDLTQCFPIKDDIQMNHLEVKLQDNNFKSYVVNELKKIGGRDVKNIVYNLLPNILSDEIAIKYSWYGAKGKLAFASLFLSNVIQDVVRSHIKDATNIEIEIPVKKWLSKAKERYERRKSKMGEELHSEEVK